MNLKNVYRLTSSKPYSALMGWPQARLGHTGADVNAAGCPLTLVAGLRAGRALSYGRRFRIQALRFSFLNRSGRHGDLSPDRQVPANPLR